MATHMSSMPVWPHTCQVCKVRSCGPLLSLQELKVPCGVAALSNVANRTKEDTMESFFLSETMKYLYLLFDPDDAVYRHGA